MSKGKIFVCEECKTMAMIIQGDSSEFICDGKKMKALTANTTDAAQEKHVPVVEADGKKISVKVGSVSHPMTEEHLIQWIYLQTKKGGQYRFLTPQDKPEANFIVAEDDEPVAVFEFCNLHGLWKASI